MADRAVRALRHHDALTAEVIGDVLELPHHEVTNERNALSQALRRLVKRGEVAKTPPAGLGMPATYRIVGGGR